MATEIRQIQVRRDTAANWASSNPTLAAGEPGVETDTGKFKIGDGSTAWNSLVNGYATKTGTETLTNKTLTSPVINTPSAEIITSLTAETVINDADILMIYDASATALRKMTRANLLAGIGASAPLILTAPTSSDIPLKVKGATSQSVDLLEALSSADAVLAKITNAGMIYATKKIGFIDYSDMNLGNLDENGNFIFEFNNSKVVKFRDNAAAVNLQIDSSATAGNTRLLIYDVDNATLERVTVGAADSGGMGYKLLRISN